ncbi:MAG: hypothetical protein LBJ75_03335 [Puniceicoccales bacterium]|nr:hypothetical protein [Puniceicoccales bacterium]
MNIKVDMSKEDLNLLMGILSKRFSEEIAQELKILKGLSVKEVDENDIDVMIDILGDEFSHELLPNYEPTAHGVKVDDLIGALNMMRPGM